MTWTFEVIDRRGFARRASVFAETQVKAVLLAQKLCNQFDARYSRMIKATYKPRIVK